MARGSNAGIDKSNSNPIEGLGVNFKDMAAFLRFVTPRRLAIIDFLYKAGPTSADGIAISLNVKPRGKVVTDLSKLTLAGLVGRSKYESYAVPWKAITISVKQSVRYTPTEKTINLPVCFLKHCAKKYSWLSLDIIIKEIQRGLPRFSCSVEPEQG